MTPTPSSSPDLPPRRADFHTLAEALDYAARGRTGCNFYTARGELLAAVPYTDLRERAHALARGLIRAGLPRGARLLLIADTDADVPAMFLACQYAAIVPVPVALPAGIGGKDSYVATLRRQLQGSGAAAAMAPAGLLGYLREAALGLDVPLIGAPADFAALPGAGADLRPFGADDLCYLQYSSGSTRFPLGVQISQRALLSNSRAIIEDGVHIVANDRVVSWLPLYHDMGLVGTLLIPLANQASVDFLTTRDFARRPLTWLLLISRNGGTISFSPTFGYDLAARRADDDVGRQLDLKTWNCAGIGGDMIQPRAMERFADRFAPCGFRRTAFVPSYGMAEATLALSFAPPSHGIEVDYVDRERLAAENIAAPAAPGDAARGFVLCGRPLLGHELQVRGPGGEALAERRVGRVFARGPSITNGYFGEPEATRRVLSADGWLDTGDLGYFVRGQIAITGRDKDLIIINGRNIWPQDLEWAVEEMPGLRRGDAAAFSVEDPDAGERVIVLVQCRSTDPAARQRLALDVQGLLRRAAAVEAEVVLVRPHALPHTSSGKLSRSRAKANFLAGAFAATESAKHPTGASASTAP